MNSITRYLLISLVLLASGSLWAATPTVTVTYLHTDLSGSVVAKSDASGNVIWRKSYASYGATTERDEDNRRGFTGHAEDPNGLVYMRNRYYDPESGRFWATDAVGLDPNDPASFNRYAYANNNPYKYVDPDGKWFESAWDWANLAQGSASLGANLAAGNYVGAAVDAVGVVADTAALAAPGVPGGAGTAIRAMRGVDEAGDAAKNAKRFSDEKQALVDMAQKDKKTGITKSDMDTYKELNKNLSDPFDKKQVRQDLPTGKSYDGTAGHGHVGPVNHIPVNKNKNNKDE